MRRHLRHLAPLVAIVGATAVLVAGAAAERVEFGNMVLNVGGGFTPKKLPAKKMAPVALTVKGSVRTKDGSTPPVLNRIQIDFDRQGTLYTKGLARCKPRKLLFKRTKQALRACRPALVGRGEALAIVDFPDQDAFRAPGPLLAFNAGPRKIILHAYAHVPAPTAFVVTGRISNAKGARWGKRVTVNVPRIAGGHGRLVRFRLRVHRRFKHRGKLRSYLIARCGTGSLQARGRFTWANGDSVFGRVVRSCRRR